jgi:hypothetical protein
MGGVASNKFSKCRYCKTPAHRAPADVARAIRRTGYCPACKMRADFEEAKRDLEVRAAEIGPAPTHLVDSAQALAMPGLRNMVIESTVLPRQERVEKALEDDEWD